MLISLFKSNQKLVNVLILVVTILLWSPAFFIDLDINTNLISTKLRWLDITISIFLIAFQSIYLNIIVNEYKLIKENSHLTGLMLVLINCCSLFFFNLNQVVIANTFIVFAFHQFLRMSNSKNNFAILFNSGFLIALATLIYPPSIVFFVSLLITLIYTTTAQWRDFIISGIGLIVPIIYFVACIFVFDDFAEFKLSDYLGALFIFHWTGLTLFIKVLLILLVGTSVLAFFNILTVMNKSVVRIKKMLVIVVLMFVVGLTTLFLNDLDYLATFLMGSIPLAIVFANFFQSIKKPWLAEILFLCLIGGVILGYFS